MQIPLYQSASAPFVSDGAGGTVARVSFSPNVFGVTWNVKQVVVSTPSGQPRFSLYKNAEIPSALLDQTYTGNQDTDITDIDVQTLDKLIGVWTGGTLGDTATAIITGTVNTGR